MANESAKRLMAKNVATLQKYVYVILGVNVRTSRCRSYLLPRLHVHSPSATHTAWMPCRRSTPHAYALQALYVLFRVYYLWDSFSRWHMGAYAAILLAYLALYSFLKLSATPKYAPLAQGGGLVSAGSDLEQKGLIECVFPFSPYVAAHAFPFITHTFFRVAPQESTRAQRVRPQSLLLAPRKSIPPSQATLRCICLSLFQRFCRYTWDLLYVTIFLQLSTGFLSDWFWLFSLVPPTIGVYYLWTMIIYPWISKPDPEPMHGEQQQKGGKRSKKAR